MNFYNFDLKEINKTYKVFWKLLKENIPSFYKLLREDNVSCNAFLFEWVLTLFSSSFDIEACTYLWDHIFFYGEYFIAKAAIAIAHVAY
jgi:Rab-GTPase-TBC domain